MNFSSILLFLGLIGIIYYFYAKSKSEEDDANDGFNATGLPSNVANLPYFGKVDVNQELDLDADAEINGHDVSLTLNLDHPDRPAGFKDTLVGVLDQMRQLEVKALSYLVVDLHSETEVKEYIEHHLQEFEAEELKQLGLHELKGKERVQAFFDQLHLIRIGIYTEPDYPYYLVFDYTISRDLTQYLLVVKLDQSGQLVDLCMES